MSFWKDKKVVVTGGRGFLGSHIITRLRELGCNYIDTCGSKEPWGDLRIGKNCSKIVSEVDIVIHAASTVGGIEFNRDHPAEMMYNNLTMSSHMMEESRLCKVRKFVNIGTICCYPDSPPLPMREESLWEGYPTPVTASYGISKRVIIAMGQAYRQQYGMNCIAVIPTNLYGPGDHFESGQKSHVIPALIRKFIQNREEVVIWGTGKATRDFLHVSDASEGIIRAAESYDKPEPVNLGSGQEVSIKEIAETIAELTDFKGRIVWDTSMPEGQPRRWVDSSRAKSEFGWEAKIGLREGLEKTIRWYRECQTKS